MEYRRLGKTGLKVSEFSFGSWVTFASARPLMASAWMGQGGPRNSCASSAVGS